MSASVEVLNSLCAEHPERPATATCARCGRFVCLQCQHSSGLCPQCEARALHSLPRGGERLRWAQVAIGLRMFASACTVVSGVWLLSHIHGDRLEMEVANAYDDFSSVVAVANLPLLVGSGVAFMRWLHLMVQTTDALGKPIGFTPGWAVGYWFIPFLNFVRPPQMMKKLWDAMTDGKAQQALLTVWWGSYLINALVSRLETSLQAGIKTPSDLVGATQLLLLGEVMLIVSGVCVLQLVRHIQAGADAQRARVGA